MGSNLRDVVCLSVSGKVRTVLGRMMVSDQPGNVLLNAFMQPLKCTSYAPSIALAHKFINNVIVVKTSNTSFRIECKNDEGKRNYIDHNYHQNGDYSVTLPTE